MKRLNSFFVNMLITVLMVLIIIALLVCIINPSGLSCSKLHNIDRIFSLQGINGYVILFKYPATLILRFQHKFI